MIMYDSVLTVIHSNWHRLDSKHSGQSVSKLLYLYKTEADLLSEFGFMRPRVSPPAHVYLSANLLRMKLVE